MSAGSPAREAFTDHLEELRVRIVICLAAWVALSAAAYCVSDRILEILVAPLREAASQAYFFAPADAFMVRVKTSLLAGFIAASPVVLWHLFRFVSPGLYASEKRAVLPVAAAASALFIGGCLFAFFAVVPFTLKFFLGYGGGFLEPMISITNYLAFVSSMVLSFGVAFNLPVVIIGLAWLGVVDAAFLARYRAHAVVAIFIASAVLTPPDVLSQIVLALPMLALYEASILGARMMATARKSASKAR